MTHYILLKANQYGLEILEKACRLALDQSLSNSDWIIDEMEKSRRIQGNENNEELINPSENNKAIQLNIPPNDDCSPYNQMLNFTVQTSVLMKVNQSYGGQHAL